MRFDKYLTTEERIQAWKSGLTYKLAEKEVLPSEFNSMCKSANALLDTTKGLLWVAALTGAPIGIAASLIHNSVKSSSKKAKELKQRRDYFRDIAERLKTELQNEGAENQ